MEELCCTYIFQTCSINFGRHCSYRLYSVRVQYICKVKTQCTVRIDECIMCYPFGGGSNGTGWEGWWVWTPDPCVTVRDSPGSDPTLSHKSIFKNFGISRTSQIEIIFMVQYPSFHKEVTSSRTIIVSFGQTFTFLKPR